MQQSGPFAAGSIDQAPRRQTRTYEPIPAPQPFWDQVRNREQTDRLAERVAREETVIQGALWDRHRQIEALLGRRVPTSLMMTGQEADNGNGAVPDADYEARLDAMRLEFPDQLAAVESRADLAARLSGEPTVTYYDTPRGPASVRTTSDGRLWLETQDGRGGPLSSFPGARPVRRADPSEVSRGNGTIASPRVRSLGERFTTTAEDMANTNPVPALGRFLVTRGLAFDEFEDPDNPGQTIRYASFGQGVADYERERRDSYRMMASGDAWSAGDASALHKMARGVATLGGAVTGSAADPTALIAPGRTVVGRVIGSVGVNAATDAVTQAADIGAGIETEYRPEQTVAAAAIGGVIQGGFEAGGALARQANPDPGGVVGALAAEIDVGSREVAARPTPPEVRAALARIDRDRMDVARFGAVDHQTAQTVQGELDNLRVPVPPSPAAERELDELFGGSEARAPDDPTTDGAPTARLEATEYQGRRILSGSFDPMEVQADPARFQSRPDAGEEGVTDTLAEVTTWDQAKAGQTIMYEDRNGRVFAVDGHQRRALSRRLIQSGGAEGARLEGRLFRQSDGWSPDDVRVVAAVTNIREASGTVLDAARVLRETPSIINDRTLPFAGDFMDVARALARLESEAFAVVDDGAVPMRNAAVIGEQAPDRPDLHLGMVDLIRVAEPRTLDMTRALVHEARLADFADDHALSGRSFGVPSSQADMISRAELRAEVLRVLKSTAPDVLAAVTRDADAIEAGGYAIARTPVEARLARDLVAFSAIDKLALRFGQVGDTFGAAAAAVMRGEVTVASGARGIVDELREATRLATSIDADRRVTIDPEAPSETAARALAPFSEPGGRGQADQIRPKAEDAEAETRASWDDLPEATEEQRALDVLRVCAPGKA